MKLQWKSFLSDWCILGILFPGCMSTPSGRLIWSRCLYGGDLLGDWTSGDVWPDGPRLLPPASELSVDFLRLYIASELPESLRFPGFFLIYPVVMYLTQKKRHLLPLQNIDKKDPFFRVCLLYFRGIFLKQLHSHCLLIQRPLFQPISAQVSLSDASLGKYLLCHVSIVIHSHRELWLMWRALSQWMKNIWVQFVSLLRRRSGWKFSLQNYTQRVSKNISLQDLWPKEM